jgi:hypothetical protein
MKISNRISSCFRKELHQVIEQKKENVDRNPFGSHVDEICHQALLPLPHPQGLPWSQLGLPTQMAGRGRLLAFLKAPFQALLAKKV